MLEFEVSPNPAFAAAGDFVRVLATWASRHWRDAILHQPLYLLDADRFLAQPRPADPELSNGFLRLHDPAAFRLVQVDAIGGGLKLANAATNLVVQNSRPAPPNMRENAGLPTRSRTAGIAIVQPSLADSLRLSALRQRRVE